MRLNAQMKDQVIAKAMKAAFDKKEADMKKRGKVTDGLIHKAMFGDDLRYVEKLSKAWYHIGKADEHHRVNLAGRSITCAFEGLKIPSKHVSWGHDTIATLTHDKHGPMIEAVESYFSDRRALDEAREKAVTTLKAMLKNIQTYERLEKEWPEGQKFYQSLPADFPFQHQVPAVAMHELNAMLGLAA